jgi:hypothetical protein
MLYNLEMRGQAEIIVILTCKVNEVGGMCVDYLLSSAHMYRVTGVFG